MKYCFTCRRLYKSEITECAHDGARLTDIQEAFSTHPKPDPFTSIDDLPAVSVDVQPHDDWMTWKAHNEKPVDSVVRVEGLANERKSERRQQLTSMGVVIGVIGLLLHSLTSPSMARGASASVEETSMHGQQVADEYATPAEPTVSSSTVVIVTKTGTVIQRMSSMAPQERWFAPGAQSTRTRQKSGNIKVARANAKQPGKFSAPTAR